MKEQEEEGGLTHTAEYPLGSSRCSTAGRVTPSCPPPPREPNMVHSRFAAPAVLRWAGPAGLLHLLWTGGRSLQVDSEEARDSEPSSHLKMSEVLCALEGAVRSRVSFTGGCWG